MNKVYVVIMDWCYDAETDSNTWIYAHEDDAKAKVREEADRVRADWVNECVDEDDRHYYAWRDCEYGDYHCDIYYREQDVL